MKARKIFLCCFLAVLTVAFSVVLGIGASTTKIALDEEYCYKNNIILIEDVAAAITFKDKYYGSTGNTPSLDTAATLAKLGEKYSNIDNITLSGTFTYPDTEPGEKTIYFSNVTARITYTNTDGYQEISPVVLTGKSAVANILSMEIDVTVKSIEVLYGEEPIYEYEHSALPEGITGISGQPIYFVGGASGEFSVGSYTVSITGGLTLEGPQKDSYRINYIDGNLEVKKREITLSVADAEVIYGENTPDLAVSVGGDGFAYNDTLETLFGSAAPECEYRAGMSVKDGGYPITLSSFEENENYEITLKKEGVLTVKPRTLYILPSAAEKRRGEEDPDFSYTYYGNLDGEIPVFSGKLGRQEGNDVGSYAYAIDGLSAVDSIPFRSTNYTIALAPDAPKFEIKEKDITLEISNVTLEILGGVRISYRLSTDGALAEGVEMLSFGIMQWSAEEYAELDSREYEDNLRFVKEGSSLSEAIYGEAMAPRDYMASYYAIAYIRHTDGIVYSEPVMYDLRSYAGRVFSEDGNENERSLLIAMLDYGSAILKYCGVALQSYPDELIDDSFRNGEEYSAALSQIAKDAVALVDSQGYGVGFEDSALFDAEMGEMSFSLRISDEMVLTLGISAAAISNGETVSLYCWEADRAAELIDNNRKLDSEKAERKEAFLRDGRYYASLDGVCAEDAGKLYYVAFAVEGDQEIRYSELKVCSVEYYAALAIESSGDAELVRALEGLLLFSSYAKDHS